MTKGEIIQMYRHMSEENQQGFEGWLKANAIIGSILAIGLLAVTIAGSDPSVSIEASAKDARSTGLGASAERVGRVDVVSPYNLTIRYAPDQLPVEQVVSPF